MGFELDIVSDSHAVGVRAAEWIARRVKEANGPVSLALAGGSTPRAAYEALAASDCPFENVSIYFGDERCVPPDDPDSNYRMARESLLDPVGLERFAAVHRIRGEESDPETEAARYEEVVPGALDLLVLGVGEDGHTASLFPHEDVVSETRRRVVAVRGPKPPLNRITLTPRALVAARSILVLVSGAAKAEAVARALEGPCTRHAVPAQLAVHADPHKIRRWIVDEAAAAALHPQWHLPPFD